MTPGLWINDVTINCQEPPFFSILLFKVCTKNNENKDKHRYCDNFQYDFCNFSHYLVISLQRFLVSLAASLLGAYSKTDWPAIRDLTYTILWLISVSNTPNLYLFKASLASRLGVVPISFSILISFLSVSDYGSGPLVSSRLFPRLTIYPMVKVLWV